MCQYDNAIPMKRFFLFACAIALLGCNGPIRKYRTHNAADINQVIKAVIVQDSLADTGLAFNINLGELTFDKRWMFDFQIDSLFDERRPVYFSKSDYSYISFQCSNDTAFTIDKSVMPKITFTTLAERTNKNRETHYTFGFYDMSVPLFSVDQQQAYLQLAVYRGMNNAIGYEYILKKVNGKWKIIFKSQTWID